VIDGLGLMEGIVGNHDGGSGTVETLMIALSRSGLKPLIAKRAPDKNT
jgi:hypothetical protein